ncbi:hypothetical protein DE146DRAFT_630202 [Phaeosphaeria sp. MPI-PUGE-AT-0046c]|nr:hypothetical protein DE146DRAFT_630202 [Phaeosphaeria sp. MPI-PUGE-AT-0046c]
MLGLYVCKQCRSRLARRVVPVRTPQWHPRATFFSLRKQTPQDKSEGTISDAQSQQEHLVETDHPESRIRYTDWTEQAQPRPQRRAGRYSQLVDEPREDGFLLATPPRSGRVTAKEGNEGPIAAIAHAIAKPGNGDNAWALFDAIYTSRDCEALRHPAEGDLAHLHDGKLYNDLLRKVSGALCYAPVKPRVTPTMVLLRYEQLGVAQPEHWTYQTLDYLTHQAILAVNATSGESKLDLPTILYELLSVWRLFFQTKGKNPQLDTLAADWNLPAPENMPKLFAAPDFSTRLNEYHPGQVGNSVLGFCAVYFYTLSEALHSNEALNQKAEPFMQFLERLLVQARITPIIGHTQRSRRFKSLPDAVQRDIVQELDNAPQRAMKKFAEQGGTLDESMRGSPSANQEALHLKRIERATTYTQSIVALEYLWKEANKAFTSNGKASIPPRIYNAFLSGFLILRQAPRSVEVWNHMIAHGVQPNMQSWVALLEGCEKAGDLAGFNAMWARMLSTGVEPDDYAWTTRVHGLFHLREINLGLAALDDMGKRWLSAENAKQQLLKNRKSGTKTTAKTVNPCAKPNIEVINGAIVALVQLRKTALRHDKRVEYVNKLMGWAGGFNIKPDTITYNALIQLYLLGSDNRTAFQILRQMEKDGVKADIATHAMLINLTFTNPAFKELSNAQQGEKIINKLNDIEAEGIKLNDYIYSTAIDRFLKYFSNHSAVRLLIEHMQQRDLVPSPYAYTSLITHYFQQDPPLINAVDSLVNQFFTAHSVATDRMLFDRVLEGYASHDEVGKMMGVLTRMSKKSAVPSWNALVFVIEALVRDGDYDRARLIVKDVHKGTGVAESYIHGRSSDEQRFFYTVKKLGIDHEEDRMGDFMRPNSGAFAQIAADDMVASAGPVRANADERSQGSRDEVPRAAADEEDIHEFLTDDHDDYHARVDRQ